MPTLQDNRLPISRKAVLWLLPLAFANGLLSAIRWPQIYSISHMVITYHFGFGKRGLIGTILQLIDRPPYHYVTLAWMAFAVFALWMITLTIAAWRDMTRDTGLAVAFVLFFLSSGFASLVCDVGRGEHFGLLMALPCLLAPVRMPWLLVRAALLVVAVLMQEANFLIVAPLVAFDVWLGSVPRARFRPALCAAATVLPATLLTWYLGNLKTACDTTAATEYFRHMAADFQVQPVPVATLCVDGAANFHLVLQALWSVGTAAVTVPLALSVALPSMLFNLFLARRVLRGSATGVVAAVAVSLAPLALLIVGADVVRFVTLIQITSLLALLSTIKRLGIPPSGTLPSSRRRAVLVTALAAFELGTALTLTDGTQMLKFPYTPLIVRAVAVAQGHAPFVVIQ
jgi:hypothetical protein